MHRDSAPPGAAPHDFLGLSPPLQALESAGRREATGSPSPCRPNIAAHCPHHLLANAPGPPQQILVGPESPPPLSVCPAVRRSQTPARPTTSVPGLWVAHQAGSAPLLRHRQESLSGVRNRLHHSPSDSQRPASSDLTGGPEVRLEIPDSL
ncbi:hypothetical protein NDU88_002249 [Pleurodeles waltl]|uniref:Uncharacterized protein n=1 Tax=Pleurodeles waltl TaxID=8319 RepID=A0AAV7UVK9_PLEWA|nr:hypothetical protein NDU88_002249 [Pleurodeles waltl]